jgi:diacylglycerol O-acyltransferase / wax synthase
VPSRLSSLDTSFLRVETPSAHMHVAWRGRFRAHATRPRPTLNALRASVASRVSRCRRFRQRLAYPPLGLGEPYWMDDARFDIRAHVTSLVEGGGPVTPRRFANLCDASLSRPLERDRPLWQVQLAPQLTDGSIGVLCKMHHAMVDGKSALELALLLLDATPDQEPEPGADWEPEPERGAARLALDSIAETAAGPLRAGRELARLSRSPVRSSASVAGTLRRAALAVSDDALRPAPASYVNAPIGPRRTLLSRSVPIDELLAAKRRAGATLNDACLAAVAGAMRHLARNRGEEPEPLKAMVPVSVRGAGEDGALGNRISFAFVDLPVSSRFAASRVDQVRAQTAAFKQANRPAGTEMVLRAAGWLPAPLQTQVARLAASPRVYNLVVSNIPGPRVAVYMLGAELLEAYPVVPLSDGHALSVGVFTHGEQACFGVYTDPEALPEASELPALIRREVRELAAPSLRAMRPRRNGGRAGGAAERAAVHGSEPGPGQA